MSQAKSTSASVPTIDELIAFPLPSDPQIAPDASAVAYVVQTTDWDENEYVNQIWLAELGAGQGEPRQITFAKEGSRAPRWSPDGRWLYFVSKRKDDEHGQIYRLSRLGGEAERLTELDCHIQTLKPAPDGKSIAFVATGPKSEADKAREEKYGDVQIEDVDAQYAHLWLWNLESKKAQKLSSGRDFHVVDFDWHPHSSQIVFAGWPSPDMEHYTEGRLYLLDCPTLTVTALTESGAGMPRWSPDGTALAFTQQGEPAFYKNSGICVANVKDGALTNRRIISQQFDENGWLQAWGPAGIYFGAMQRTSYQLLCIDPESGQFWRVTPPDAQSWPSAGDLFGGISFTPNFSHAALTYADHTRCAEIIVIALKNQSVSHQPPTTSNQPPTTSNQQPLTYITNFDAQTAAWPLAQHEVIQWSSRDGATIEGVLTKPIDFDPARAYPLLVVIHGGPTAVSIPSKLSYYERRYYPIQQWAAKGALILQPNYRGSGGYGESFRELNVRNLGVGDAWDVISGVDHLIAQGWVDGERVGAMGWSQGGYISAFLTTSSDRFKATSVGAGISNWMTYYVNTDIHPFTRQYLGATPWDDADIYAKTSPMTYIKNAQTPTLIQHGELDRRVPIPNAYELYQGLRDMGVETRLAIYKGQPHGIGKPRLNRHVMTDNWQWFNRWLWGEAPDEASEHTCYVVLAGDASATTNPKTALESYGNAQVQNVYHAARRDEVAFRLFAGAAGLVQADDGPPASSACLGAQDVSTVAAILAQQLQAAGFTKIVLWSEPPKEKPQVLISLGCLQVAAGIVEKVSIEQRDFE